jgi:phosphatidylinositol alpha 1,6-mannosyltransferase
VDSAAEPVGPELRVALFTGNYNYIKDGVALTLNRLVAYLMKQGIPVLVFAPVGDAPAFQSVGDLVPVPSMAIPMRSEYRIALGFPRAARERLRAFRPTLIHIAVPDILGHEALKQAEEWNVPVVASYHTRFDAYLRFYGLGPLEKFVRHRMCKFYTRMDRVYPPSESMAEIIRSQGQSQSVEVWARGVDSLLFSPARRDEAWRQSVGLGADDIVVSFAGRLVKEKNTAVYCSVMKALAARGLPVKAMIIGDGPEMAAMKAALPNGLFPGFLHGEELARAYASSDIFFFPSESETFGNVTLEAMASGLPAVNAIASGSSSLVEHGRTGFLERASDQAGLAARIECLVRDADLRRRMGVAARRRAEQFDWDAILAGLIDSYRRVVREARSEDVAGRPTVWVLWRRRKGDLDQMAALLDAAGWSHTVKTLSFWKPEIPFLAPLLLKGRSDRLAPPWPDFVVSAEAMPSVIARRLKRRSGGSIKTVCVGRPAGSTRAFDLVVTSAQYRIPPAPNVVELSMPLTTGTAAGHTPPCAFEGQRPLIVLAVGGTSFPDRLDAGAAEAMAAALRQYAEEKGGTLLVVTSPRTGSAITQLLKDAIPPPHFTVAYGEEESQYRAVLAAADEIVVTSDSVSMVADALESGKPVSIYPLPRRLRLKWKVAEWLYRHAVERPSSWLKPVTWAFEAGLLETVADRRLLFDKLVAGGQLDWFGKPLRQPQPGTSRRDLALAVERLRALNAMPT